MNANGTECVFSRSSLPSLTVREEPAPVAFIVVGKRVLSLWNVLKALRIPWTLTAFFQTPGKYHDYFRSLVICPWKFRRAFWEDFQQGAWCAIIWVKRARCWGHCASQSLPNQSFVMPSRRRSAGRGQKKRSLHLYRRAPRKGIWAGCTFRHIAVLEESTAFLVQWMKLLVGQQAASIEWKEAWCKHDM